jgi:hypothetical protein
MLMPNQTGYRFHQLSGPGGQSPAFAHSTQLQFDLANLPLLTGDRLANYVVGIVLTFSGTFDYEEAGAAPGRHVRSLIRGLIDSIELTGAWHGAPLQAQTFRGRTLDVIETIGCDYRRWGRTRPNLDDTADTPQSVNLSVFLPLCHGPGPKAHHTAQLAMCYLDSQLQINTATAAAMAALDDTGVPTWTNVNGVKATAILLPDSELRLGPASEWMEYRQPAQSGSDQVSLLAFGNQTALQGVEPGAAVDTVLALCSIDTTSIGTAPDGSFQMDTLSRFSAPFIGQEQTTHLEVLMDAFNSQVEGMGNDMFGGLISTPLAVAAGTTNWQFGDFPYDGGSPGDATGPLNPGAWFLPIRFPGRELELSKIPVFEGTATYYRTATVSGTDRTLCHQFKSWTPAAQNAFRDMLVQSGLALKVAKSNNLAPSVKTYRKNVGQLDAAKARFLPIKWSPAA